MYPLHETHEDKSWMMDAHLRVDEVLARFSEFDKVKTIGDIVMIGGCFDGSATVPATCTAMLQALWSLKDACKDICRLKSGFHVGEVMGVVLGTSRLCFDVFGDCVNTASRVYSTMPTGRYTGCTEAFYEKAKEAGSLQYEFTETQEVFAKGKGNIPVRYAL
jgi:adenylate cyclase